MEPTKGELPPDILPVLAADVESSNPPPSYEEVMGQFVTSVPREQAELPALSYIDIMPRLLDPGYMKQEIAPVFENFSDIMRGANAWLQGNPGLRVWKCETVERKVQEGPMVHLDSTRHHESTYGANFYVCGVRLWLTLRQDPSEPIQELALLNVPPPTKQVPVTVHRSMGFGMGMGMSDLSMFGITDTPGMNTGINMDPAFPIMTFGRRRHGVTMVTQGMMEVYEDLTRTVESYNEVTKEEPLEGSILNVETTSVKFGDTFNNKVGDPDVTSWSEGGKGRLSFLAGTRRSAKILRVFYVKGKPQRETLNMTMFQPNVLKQPEANRCARFETFDVIEGRARQWLQSQNGIRVVNIETRESEFKGAYGFPVSYDPNSTRGLVIHNRNRNMIRYLRVFYVNAPATPPYNDVQMTSRLFMPAATKGREFETMPQTMQRINAWMSAVGAPVFSVETTPFLLENNRVGQPDRLDYKYRGRVGNYWLTCIRLYFKTPFQEPIQQGSAGNKSSTCGIL